MSLSHVGTSLLHPTIKGRLRQSVSQCLSRKNSGIYITQGLFILSHAPIGNVLRIITVSAFSCSISLINMLTSVCVLVGIHTNTTSASSNILLFVFKLRSCIIVSLGNLNPNIVALPTKP